MCADAGVKLVYLPPYPPDLDPIGEFFAELKVSSSGTGRHTKTTQIKALMLFWNGALMLRAGKRVVRKVILGMRDGAVGKVESFSHCSHAQAPSRNVGIRE